MLITIRLSLWVPLPPSLGQGAVKTDHPDETPREGRVSWHSSYQQPKVTPLHTPPLRNFGVRSNGSFPFCVNHFISENHVLWFYAIVCFL